MEKGCGHYSKQLTDASFAEKPPKAVKFNDHA